MTRLELEVRRWILRALDAARGPLPEDTLKRSVRTAHPGVRFTDGDLNGHIRDCEELGCIAGTDDEVMGRIWDLTPKGRIRAQQLR